MGGELQPEGLAQRGVREEGLQDPPEGRGGDLVGEGEELLQPADQPEGVGLEEPRRGGAGKVSALTYLGSPKSR